MGPRWDVLVCLAPIVRRPSARRLDPARDILRLGFEALCRANLHLWGQKRPSRWALLLRGQTLNQP